MYKYVPNRTFNTYTLQQCINMSRIEHLIHIHYNNVPMCSKHVDIIPSLSSLKKM